MLSILRMPPKLGVDIDNLLVSQPDYGEQALEIVEALVRSNAIDVLVVDSVAALVPKAELDGEMGDSHMGLQARLMSQALRKLTGTVSKSRTCLIFINQIRDKIGVMFGNPETTTGGKALKFYSSVRIDIRRIGAVKDGDSVVGSRTKVKIVKNKVAAPFRDAEFDILYGEGISREGDVLDLAVLHNIVDKSGAWYSYQGERIGQGRENVRAFLKENKDVFARVDTETSQEAGDRRRRRTLMFRRFRSMVKRRPRKWCAARSRVFAVESRLCSEKRRSLMLPALLSFSRARMGRPRGMTSRPAVALRISTKATRRASRPVRRPK